MIKYDDMDIEKYDPVCPLLSIVQVQWSSALRQCVSKKCAWYDEFEGQCSMKTIAERIRDISEIKERESWE